MNYRKWLAATAAAAVLTAGLLSGCGSDQQQAMPNAKVDTFKGVYIRYADSASVHRHCGGFAGSSCKRLKVSGTVTEKYVKWW